MSTETPRLGLTKPTPAEQMSQGDNVLTGNYDIIDSVIAAKPVDDLATDIPTPYQGQLAYERPTKELKHYTGTKWGFTASAFAARGRLDQFVRSSLNITPADGTVFIGEVQFPGIVGRKFLVRWRVVGRYFEADADSQVFKVFFTANEGPRPASFDSNLVVRDQRIVFETTVTLSDVELHQHATGFFEVTTSTSSDPWNVSMWIDNVSTNNTRLEISPLNADETVLQIEDWSN